MTTPQDPAVRNKQKRRRTRKLAEWRLANPKKPETKTAEKAAAKK